MSKTLSAFIIELKKHHTNTIRSLPLYQDVMFLHAWVKKAKEKKKKRAKRISCMLNIYEAEQQNRYPSNHLLLALYST